MTNDVRDNFAVEVNYHGHRYDVAAGEYNAHEEVVVEGIGQVVERAGGEVALWKERREK